VVVKREDLDLKKPQKKKRKKKPHTRQRRVLGVEKTILTGDSLGGEAGAWGGPSWREAFGGIRAGGGRLRGGGLLQRRKNRGTGGTRKKGRAKYFLKNYSLYKWKTTREKDTNPPGQSLRGPGRKGSLGRGQAGKKEPSKYGKEKSRFLEFSKERKTKCNPIQRKDT